MGYKSKKGRPCAIERITRQKGDVKGEGEVAAEKPTYTANIKLRNNPNRTKEIGGGTYTKKKKKKTGGKRNNHRHLERETSSH